MWGWYNGMMDIWGFGGGWMLIIWIIIIGLIVWGVIALIRYTSQGTGEKRQPLGIAKERYAKGEISKEEYERIKKDLS